MAVADELELDPAANGAPAAGETGDGWRKHPDGYEFVPRKGRPHANSDR